MKTELSVRVYYEDTDFSGVVYHANYLKFFERGRTEALRETGIDHADMFAEDVPLVFVVRHMDIDFLKPAKIDDLLSVTTEVVEVKGARMVFKQQVKRGDELLVKSDVLVACITAEGRPTRIPKSVLGYFKGTGESAD